MLTHGMGAVGDALMIRACRLRERCGVGVKLLVRISHIVALFPMPGFKNFKMYCPTRRVF